MNSRRSSGGRTTRTCGAGVPTCKVVKNGTLELPEGQIACAPPRKCRKAISREGGPPKEMPEGHIQGGGQGQTNLPPPLNGSAGRPHPTLALPVPLGEKCRKATSAIRSRGFGSPCPRLGEPVRVPSPMVRAPSASNSPAWRHRSAHQSSSAAHQQQQHDSSAAAAARQQRSSMTSTRQRENRAAAEQRAASTAPGSAAGR